MRVSRRRCVSHNKQRHTKGDHSVMDGASEWVPLKCRLPCVNVNVRARAARCKIQSGDLMVYVYTKVSRYKIYTFAAARALSRQEDLRVSTTVHMTNIAPLGQWPLEKTPCVHLLMLLAAPTSCILCFNYFINHHAKSRLGTKSTTKHEKRLIFFQFLICEGEKCLQNKIYI